MANEIQLIPLSFCLTTHKAFDETISGNILPFITLPVVILRALHVSSGNDGLAVY